MVGLDGEKTSTRNIQYPKSECVALTQNPCSNSLKIENLAGESCFEFIQSILNVAKDSKKGSGATCHSFIASTHLIARQSMSAYTNTTDLNHAAYHTATSTGFLQLRTNQLPPRSPGKFSFLIPIPLPLYQQKYHMGVSKNRGTKKWMVKIMENPIKNGMIWGETPLFSETSISGTSLHGKLQENGSFKNTKKEST